MQVPKQRLGEATGEVFGIALAVQQVHMGKPSDAHGETFPISPHRAALMPVPFLRSSVLQSLPRRWSLSRRAD